MASHGDCHTQVDALNHVAYRGQLYNGKPASLLTSRGSQWGSIAAYASGIVAASCWTRPATARSTGSSPARP